MLIAKLLARSGLIALGLAVATMGCSTVSPTQRGILAKPEMQFDHDLAHIKIVEHTYASKEAAAGGRATGGGGCGCGG
jgi:Domain of unknown function (DUF4266)